MLRHAQMCCTMRPIPGATRIERSFAFVDLCGFTWYTDVQGDDEAVDILLNAFRAVVRGVASARGVRIAKWLGDGAMLVGVEPEPLLEALVEIEALITDSGSPLPLRAGFTTGPRHLDRR
jgi:adenylate cyclase